MKKNVLIIGAGGVAQVVAHKCAQNNDVLGDIHIASRTKAKCDKIIASVHEKKAMKQPGVLEGHASAVLAASIFHFGTFSVREAKEHLAAAGIPVRLT